MSGLVGKLSVTLEIRSKGDLFHELFRHSPHQVSSITPERIQGCDLHEGDWGSPGSTIFWKYTHDGKEKIAKETIDINEETKTVTMKVIEGDLLELYKNFTVHVHVDTNRDIHHVIWEFEYEKLKDDVEEPVSLLQFVIHLTKDIESHHLLKDGSSQ